MSTDSSVSSGQKAREARARGRMATVLLVGALAMAAVLIPFAEDSVFGRTAAVLGSTFIVLAVVSACLYALNRRLTDSGHAPHLAGATDLVLGATLLLPVVAVAAVLVLARPFELIQIPAVAFTMLLCAQLVFVAVATRHAVRRD